MPARKEETIDGEKLRCLRILKGIKQTTVADALGISHQAYSKIERCKNVGTRKTSQVLAALNSSIDDLDKIKVFTPPTHTLKIC